MYIIKKDDIIVIPLAYNLYINRDIDVDVSFKERAYLDRSFKDKLLHTLRTNNSNSIVKCILLDMVNVDGAESRIFQGFDKIEKLIFVNISNESMSFSSKIKLDLESNGSNCVEIKSNDSSSILYCNENVAEFSKDKFSNIEEFLRNTYDETIANIVRDVSAEEVSFLESSSVYSNMYINMRKLFVDYRNYIFVVYRMATFICKNVNQFDSFICSSKTGAMFAILLGAMFNKKVVNCIFLGPVYTGECNGKNLIRPNKKYFYIGDFVCLGTEFKLLDSYVNLNNAEIVNGLAVASYIDLKNNDLEKSVMKKIDALIHIMKFDFDYEISAVKINGKDK